AGAASPREAVSLTPALSSAATAACQKRGSELSCSSSVSQAVAGGAAPLSIHELRSVVLPVPGGAASSVSLRVATAEERLSNTTLRRTGGGGALEQARARDGAPPPPAHGRELGLRDARLHRHTPRTSPGGVRAGGPVLHGHRDVRTPTRRLQ